MPTRKPKVTKPGYLRHKARAAKRQRQQTVKGQDIGRMPKVKDPERKALAFDSLLSFCVYFPDRFPLPFCRDHLSLIQTLEQAATFGGLVPVAMPRGFGKTTICEVAGLWALFTGRQEFLFLIAATRGLALEMLDSIKKELETNELLAADWPEVCYPIQCLEGESRRCLGQRYKEHRTNIVWKQDHVVLPTIPGSKASQAVLFVSGITGSIRGKKFKRHGGAIVRPGFALLDDPQTDGSAVSIKQTDCREDIIKRAVLGLAGHGKKIAAVMPCTAIAPDDLVCRIFDRAKNPQWSGHKFKMLYKFPAETKLWEDYADMRDTEFRNGGNGAAANQFYAANRAKMDEGAIVAWPEKYDADELSGLHHAMNLYFRDKRAFMAERQSEPVPVDETTLKQLEPVKIAARCNGLPRQILPRETTRITAFIDVQQELFYWLVAAWQDDFTGSIIDYGTWPDQGRRYFAASSAERTLFLDWRREHEGEPNAEIEALIFAGLTRCTNELLGRTWQRIDGAPMKIDRLLIDSGFKGETVFSWCQQSPHSAVVMPSRGRFVGATSKPWHEYQRRPGARLGLHWESPAPTGGAVRHLVVDVNWWKTFVYERLNTAMGGKAALTLFGKSPDADHRLFADHCCAEKFVPVTAKDRTVIEWKLTPGQDNHWWDCIVGCAAAASFQGAVLFGTQTVKPPTKPANNRQDYEAKRAAFEARRGF